MAISALKFIGLAVGAVALGVLSASFAFSHMGSVTINIAGDEPKGRSVLNYDSKTTEDEMPGRIRHIVRRH